MVLGLTGSIASGKSTVAGWFAELGAALVSADQLARDVVAPGQPALAKLVELFGDEVLAPDGTLNRARVADRVFAHPDERRRLEEIVHPAIGVLAEERLGELRARGVRLIVYEAPLLFEAGGTSRVDRILVVLVDPGVQLARLCQRDGLDQKAARARIDAQLPQADKVARADYVIDNSATLSRTRQNVVALYHYLTSAASSS